MELLHSEKLLNMVYAAGLIITGILLAKRISLLIRQRFTSHFSRHHVMLVSRITFYLIFIMFFVSGLQHLGFNLNVLLGAAGVFTVAISFASQTAASNLISGIFLLFERPFHMGDSIEVNDITGIVESIDLLSTKLRTPDNKLVRIPNETLIKSEISNLNYYRTRRLDMLIRISYSSDIAQIKTLLLAIAADCSHVLSDPEPEVNIHKFAELVVELQFNVWVNNQDISNVKNQLHEEIKQQFEQAGIEMPTYSSQQAWSLQQL